MSSWKTSVCATALLVFAGMIVYRDPSKIADPTVMAILTAALGLFKAADHVDTKGTQ